MWPIVAKGREEERRAAERAREEQEAEPAVPADYNPALVPPLRAGKKTTKKRR